jgi:hypothetical protein
VLGLFLYLFLGCLLGYFLAGFFWVFGWDTYVYFEALRAFLVYLEAHCAFLIYSTSDLSKKKMCIAICVFFFFF